MTLNLPQYDIKTRKNTLGQLQVYDRLRDKYVALTPEEYVRQHFVNFLIEHRGYPPHLMANEIGIRLNRTLKRCDTVVFDNAASPLAIIEYKAPHIAINAKVFDQIVRYNMVLGVKWLMVSNGLSHFCCSIDQESGKYTFLKDIPNYDWISVE